MQYLSLIVCLAGLAIYLICSGMEKPPEAFKEIGRIMFFTGLAGVVWFGKNV